MSVHSFKSVVAFTGHVMSSEQIDSLFVSSQGTEGMKGMALRSKSVGPITIIGGAYNLIGKT
jgi:hypothetical protein